MNRNALPEYPSGNLSKQLDQLIRNQQVMFQQILRLNDQYADFRAEMESITKALESILSIYADIRTFEHKFFRQNPPFQSS